MLVRGLILAVLMAALASPAHADSDHERARSALQSGQVRPLDEILGNVRRDHPGRMLDAQLGDGRYNIKLLNDRGNVTEVEVDARNSRVLGVREGDRGGRGGGRGEFRREGGGRDGRGGGGKGGGRGRN